MLSQIVFVILIATVAYLCWRFYGQLIRNIQLGKPIDNDKTTRGQRLKNTLLVALGQKKMFKRPIPALLHFAIYVAFLFTQIELIEIIVDGISGKHRVFAKPLGALYTVIINTIEILSLLALLATIIFLWRRNVSKVKRFTNPEMSGWPSKDANLILLGEILLVFGIFSMNSADGLLQLLDSAHYPDTGPLLLSGALGNSLLSNLSADQLHIIERFGWWLHVLLVFGFLIYLPISKHLHIIFAFPNTYHASLKAKGEMNNMPDVMKEVKSMMGLIPEDAVEMSEEIPNFGAKDVMDLNQRSLLGAYSCTECGRCTSVCPANITGKKLSPRKIMMDVRDRATEVGANISTGNDEFKANPDELLSAANYDDGKSLFDRISKEELHACTTCNACVEACPVLINPLEIILDLRRYEILTESAGPSDWVPMFTSLENSGAVWQVSQSRTEWTKGITVE